MKATFTLLLAFFSLSASAYECKVTRLSTSIFFSDVEMTPLKLGSQSSSIQTRLEDQSYEIEVPCNLNIDECSTTASVSQNLILKLSRDGDLVEAILAIEHPATPSYTQNNYQILASEVEVKTKAMSLTYGNYRVKCSPK